MERKKAPDTVSTAIAMLEATFSPLARMMIRDGMSAGDLIQAVKISFLQAAIGEIVAPGTKVNVSQVAVVTGLTRKDVAALLQRKTEGRAPQGKKALEQRALRVLHGWSADPMFQRPNMRPADLPIHGEHQKSFATLVKRYGGDVTPISVLRELERMDAVSVTPAGKVKANRKYNRRSLQPDRRIGEFNRLVKDFSATAQQLFEPKDPALFFAFKDSTVNSPQQAALFQRTFSRRAAVLVEGIDQWFAHQRKSKDSTAQAARSKTRVGLGVYLIQESND